MLERLRSKLFGDGEPVRFLFLIAPQRSGTTVLRETLATSGLFDPYGEVFHPEKGDYYSFFHFLKTEPECAQLYLFPTKENKTELFTRFLEYCHQRSTKRYVFIDVKQNSLHHFNTIWHSPSQPPFLLDLLVKGNHPIIRLVRANLFKQALSTIVAKETGTWHLRAGEKLDTSGVSLRIDPAKMLRRMNALQQDNEMIDRALEGHKRLVKLFYEEMFVGNNLLAPNIPRKLAKLMKEAELKNLPRQLPLAKSITSERDLVSNQRELLRFFADTPYDGMVREALAPAT
ncbi:MAG: hypothetical protein PWP23_407 [Candidatus Sumerlaeota bacterium]|nr:hypothetical protein [Candidatus Sumerlaeota bacterium]